MSNKTALLDQDPFKRKVRFYLVFCLLFFFSLSLLEPASKYILRKSVDLVATSLLGQPLHYEDIQWKKKTLLLKRVSLGEELEGAKLRIDELSIKSSFHFSRHFLHVEGNFNEASFQLYASKEALKTLKSWLRAPKPLQFLTLNLQVAPIHIECIEEDTRQAFTGLFSYFSEGNDQTMCQLQLEQSDNHIEALYYQKEEEKSLKVKVKQWSASSGYDLLNFMSSLLEQRTLNWTHIQGELQGEMTLESSHSHFPMLLAHLEASGLHIEKGQGHYGLEFPWIKADFEAPLRKNKELKLTLENLRDHFAQNTLGHMTCSPTSSCYSMDLERKKQLLALFSGQVEFFKHRPTHLSVTGKVLLEELFSPFTLEALGFLKWPRGDVELKINHPLFTPSQLRLSFDPWDEKKYKLRMTIKEFKASELMLLKKFFEPHLASLEKMQFKEGRLSTDIQGIVEEKVLSHIKVNELKLSHMDLYHFLGFEEIKGMKLIGDFEFPGLNLKAFRKLQGKVQGSCHRLIRQQNLFEKLSGLAEVEGGKLKTARAKVQWKNIQGQLDWKESRTENPLILDMKGHFEDFLPLLPPSLCEAYQGKFTQHEVQARLKGVYQFPIWDCQLAARLGNDPEVVLNFKIQKERAKKLNEFKMDLFSDSFLKDLPFMPSLTLLDRSPFFTPFNGYRLLGGQFEGKQLDLEKYLMPLFLGKSPFYLRGKADLKGHFNADTLKVTYSHYDFEMDHQDVILFLSDQEESYPAEHYFQLNTQKHFGQVNLQKARLLIKDQGVWFSDLKGRANIHSQGVYIPMLEGRSEDLPMRGELFLTFLPKGALDLKLYQLQGNSSFASLNRFLESFEIKALKTLPFYGEVSIYPSRSSFHLIRGEKTKYEMKIEGKFHQEGLGLQESKFQLEDISTQFFYDSTTSFLLLENIRGKLKAPFYESLQMVCPVLHLPLNQMTPSSFDLKIQNERHTLGRLQGELLLDPNCSFSRFDIKLKAAHNYFGPLTLNQLQAKFAENELQFCYVDVHLQLEDLFQGDSKLDLMPSSFVNKMPLSGKMMGQWVYGAKEAGHHFSFWGDQISGPNVPSGPLNLKGKIKDKTLDIEEFKFNDYKLTLKCLEKDQLLALQDFRCYKQQDFYLNLSGEVDKATFSFKGQIHKLFADVKPLQSFFSKENFDLEGKVDLKGRFFCSDPFNHAKVKLDVSGKMIGLKSNWVTLSSEPFHLLLEKDEQGFHLPYFKGKISEVFQQKCPLKIIAKKIDLHKSWDQSSIGALNFQVAAKALKQMKPKLIHWISSKWADTLLGIKSDGMIEGCLCYQPDQKDYSLKITLQDGHYLFKDKLISLSDLLYAQGGAGQLLQAKLYAGTYPYWMTFRQDHYLKDHLFFTLHDKNPRETQLMDNPGLVGQFTQENEGAWGLKTLSGRLGGLKMNWVKATQLSESTFKGQIEVEDQEVFERLRLAYFPSLTKIPLGCGYFLSGFLKLDFDHLENFSFEGLLGGQNYELGGYEFKSLSSQIFIDPQKMILRDLKLTDLSGEMAVKKVLLKKEGKKLNLEVPFLSIHNFKPSLLQKKGQEFMGHKPLIIEKVELKNVKGDLNQIQTLIGEGSLTFRKSTKKMGSLLNLPSHLISKLGLDLKMLNPVEGKVFYEIKNKKLIVTRFVDMYSQDRNCHFNVLKHPESFLDFEGNLDIRIKMKQYVLLKFTEPYIISINGSILDPHFSLQRRKVKVDVPLQTAP